MDFLGTQVSAVYRATLVIRDQEFQDTADFVVLAYQDLVDTQDFVVFLGTQVSVPQVLEPLDFLAIQGSQARAGTPASAVFLAIPASAVYRGTQVSAG